MAQRLRELAVLAAVGAVLTFGLIALLSAFGIALPGSGIKVTPQIVNQGIFLDTVITLFSVMIPPAGPRAPSPQPDPVASRP